MRIIRIPYIIHAAGLLAVAASPLAAQIHFTAALDGTQQVPSVATSASGTGSFELNAGLTQLIYFISYQGMEGGAIAGYLHTGEPGVNGTIVKSLPSPTATSGTFSGIWTSTDAEPLTPAIAESLLAGKVYIDFEDSRNPQGEIRGQLALATPLHFEVNCSGSQESPADSAHGGATGVLVLNETRSELDYRITYRGLSGPLASGAEIDAAPAGMNGPAVRTVASPGSPASGTVIGTWRTTDAQPLTDALIDSMIAGKLYLNFFTPGYPEGEVRGQLMMQDGIGFASSLDSTQENPSSMTGATGTASFILNEDHSKLTYVVTYAGLPDGIPAVAQVHVGADGQNGIAVKTIMSAGTPSEGTIIGIWSSSDLDEALTPGVASSLLEGSLYLELHTTADTSSLIRDQLRLTTGIGLTAELSAGQDVPPTVVSNGTGTASIVVSPDRQSVAYSLTFLNLTSNISPAGGHFHVAAKGTNGLLVRTIVPPNAWGAGSVNGIWAIADSGAEPLTPAIVNSFIANNVYINLHTGNYIGGEIRGQVSYAADQLTSVALSHQSAPVNFNLSQNYPNPFNPTTTIRFSVSQPSYVTLKIFDVVGKGVETLVSEEKTPGSYEVRFDASRLSSGVYFFRFQAGGFSSVRKMVFAK